MGNKIFTIIAILSIISIAIVAAMVAGIFCAIQAAAQYMDIERH